MRHTPSFHPFASNVLERRVGIGSNHSELKLEKRGLCNLLSEISVLFFFSSPYQ